MVGPLALNAGVDATSPADLASAPAVRLFVERVRDVQPDFRLTLATGPVVTAICGRLDALPLALELAAPWMKVLTAEDLLRRLMHDVLRSTAGPRDVPDGQQKRASCVAWSYQLLAPSEQRSVPPRGAVSAFPVEAAAAVLAGRDGSSAGSDDALGAVAALIDKVCACGRIRQWRRVRVRMLETVRAYAALELTAAGESEGA
jgi:non-specific serine/threonine protein kinase